MPSVAAPGVGTPVPLPEDFLTTTPGEAVHEFQIEAMADSLTLIFFESRLRELGEGAYVDSTKANARQVSQEALDRLWAESVMG